MELDKRIKNNYRPLCVLDIKRAMGFIGQNGFFADAINYFDNLLECGSGKLVSVEDKKYIHLNVIMNGLICFLFQNLI